MTYKAPAIPSIPPSLDGSLRNLLTAMKEALEVRVGQRGAALDASPTFRDLVDSGVINLKDGVTLNGRTYTAGQLSNLFESTLPTWITSDTAPPAPVGLAVTASVTNTRLTWNASTADSYLQTQVWRSTSNNLSTAVQVGSTSGNTYLDGLPDPGVVYYYWIRDESRTGLLGAFNAVSGASASGAAAAPLVSYVFEGPDVVMTWPTPTSSLAIQFYVIEFYNGSSWEQLDVVGGNAARFKVTWGGSRSFRVTAVDVGGQTGGAGTLSVAIAPCIINTLAAEVIDNNVLLRWTSTKGSIPIERFELRRGASWASGTLVGLKDGGFTTVFETVGGTYTYWMAGIDSAGVYGTPISATCAVTQPPDYVLATRWASTFSGTKVNAVAEGNILTLPVNTSETWAQHFSTRGWTSPQSQISAGYPIYGQPGVLTGYYEEVFDYGLTLAAMKVSASYLLTTVSGSVSSSITITVAQDAGFTTGVQTFTAAQAFAVNFRYVKVRIDVTATNDLGLAKISGLTVVLDAKLKTMSGVVNAVDTDAGGTVVYLTDDKLSTGNKVFADVEAIVVSPLSTTNVTTVYDFVDAPYPLSFKVLAFDQSGTRVTRTISYTVRGY